MDKWAVFAHHQRVSGVYSYIKNRYYYVALRREFQ